MYFHCALKGKKKKRLQRVHWDYPEDGPVCSEGLSLFTNRSNWSNNRPCFSPRTLSLLEWSTAVVQAKNPQSSLRGTIHHKTLWEPPATWCCPKSKVCCCSKTLQKLQRAKTPPKERFPRQRGTVGPLPHCFDSCSIFPKHVGWEGNIQARQLRNPTAPCRGQKSCSHPVPFCTALWCFAHNWLAVSASLTILTWFVAKVGVKRKTRKCVNNAESDFWHHAGHHTKSACRFPTISVLTFHILKLIQIHLQQLWVICLHLHYILKPLLPFHLKQSPSAEILVWFFQLYLLPNRRYYLYLQAFSRLLRKDLWSRSATGLHKCEKSQKRVFSNQERW